MVEFNREKLTQSTENPYFFSVFLRYLKFFGSPNKLGLYNVPDELNALDSWVFFHFNPNTIW